MFKKIKEKFFNWLDRQEWVEKVTIGPIFAPDKKEIVDLRIFRVLRFLWLGGLILGIPCLILNGILPPQIINGKYYILLFGTSENIEISKVVFYLYWIIYIPFLSFGITFMGIVVWELVMWITKKRPLWL